MTTARVVTWNVLHRVHGENWSEPVLAGHPDEAARTRAIAATVARWIDDGVDAALLQEASGDVVAAVREAVGDDVAVLVHVYPRVPRPRVPIADGGTPLDPGEHLVIVARGAALVESATFDDDPGKGWLAARLPSGIVAFCTHISYGARRRGQLARVASSAARKGQALVAGDFNAPAGAVLEGLGLQGARASELEGAGFTRVAAGTQPGKVIDHVVAIGGAIEGATILDGASLSDHLPVAATVRWG